MTKAFYPQLFYFRKKVLKMSVSEVIKNTSMSESTYLRCENGKRELTLSEADAISKNMGISMYELFPNFFKQNVANMQQNDS